MTEDNGRRYCPSVMNRWQHTGAFVVQFCSETDVTPENYRGRVEHIATSRGTHFDSLAGLIGFFEQALANDQAAEVTTAELPDIGG